MVQRVFYSLITKQAYPRIYEKRNGRHLVNVCNCMMNKYDILRSTYLGTCAHYTHTRTKNDDREHTRKMERERAMEGYLL
jgi:hypothetical protein